MRVKGNIGKRTGWLLVVLALSMVTGCAGTFWTYRAGDAADSGAAAAAHGGGKTTTLRIELFDRSNTPADAPPITDNRITRYIQESFGDPNQIKVEFVTVPRSEEVEKLNVLMKANQAPDIVFTYSRPVVANLVTQGALADLTDLLDRYGLDLKKVLGEEVLQYGVFDGKQLAIPAVRVIRAQSTTLIREDWLRQVGLPLPQTTEQFYEALKAFKEQIPAKEGQEIIPFSLIDDYHLLPLLYSFWQWDDITEEDLYADPYWVMPGNKEAFRLINRMYHEGLLDPNFAFDREMKQYLDGMIGGRIGAASPNTNEPVYMGYLAEMQDNDPEAVLTPIDPFASASGKKIKPITEATGMYIMVPKYSRNAEAAVKYLNWMSQPEHYFTLQNGFEGITYEMKDGIPIALDNEETRRTMFNYFDYCIVINGKFVSPGNDWLNLKANAFDPRYERFTLLSVEYGMNDGVQVPSLDVVIPSEAKYADMLDEKSDEMFVKVITAGMDEFDAVYDREVEDYLRMGAAQVMQEKHLAYRRERAKQ